MIFKFTNTFALQLKPDLVDKHTITDMHITDNINLESLQARPPLLSCDLHFSQLEYHYPKEIGMHSVIRFVAFRGDFVFSQSNYIYTWSAFI